MLQYTSVHIYYTWIPNNVFNMFYFFCKVATTYNACYDTSQYTSVENIDTIQDREKCYLHVLIISYPKLQS